MATVLNITPLQPVAATNGTKQNLWEAVDVAAFDILDLELVVITPASSASLVTLITGMQIQTEDGWVALTTNFSQSTAGSVIKTFDKGFLRYIRWSCDASGTAPTFYIRGMGRRYGSG
jgi:hypothetical protein